MSNGKLSSRERQRLRREANTAVAAVPIPFAFEALATRLDVKDGRFAARVHGGYLQHVTRTRAIDLDTVRQLKLPRCQHLDEMFEALAEALGARNATMVFDVEANGSLSDLTIKDAFSASALMERTLVPSGRMGLPREEW